MTTKDAAEQLREDIRYYRDLGAHVLYDDSQLLKHLPTERTFPDIVPFLASAPPEVDTRSAAHPEWNDNGSHEDIPDEMYMLIFQALHDAEAVIDMRLVCSRFRRVVDAPMSGLRSEYFSVRSTVDIGHDTDDEPRETSLDYLRETRKHNLFALTQELTHFALGERGHTIVAQFRAYATLTFTCTESFPLVIDTLFLFEKQRSYFRSLRLNMGTSSIALEGHIDMARVVQRLRDPTTGSDERNAVERILRSFTKQFYRSALDTALTPFMQHMQVGRRPHLPSENGASVVVTSAQPLHPFQLHLIDWMQGLERRIIRGQPVATYDGYDRGCPHLRGTPFAFDLAHTDKATLTDCTLPRPVLELYARGGIIADEVGLGKTRSVVTFLLGCPQEGLEAPPRDRLVLTRSTTLGNLEHVAVVGLIQTQASLVVCRNSLVVQWAQEAQLSYPHKKIIVLTKKLDHVKLTYLDVATADLVIVTTSFLTNTDHYEKLRARYSQQSEGVRTLPRTCINLERRQTHLLQHFSVQHLTDVAQLKALGSRTCPLLDVFAWPRMAIDEVHEHILSKGVPSPTIYVTGVAYFSVRSMWLVSATHLDSLRVRNRGEYSDFYKHGMCTLLNCVTTTPPPYKSSYEENHFMTVGTGDHCRHFWGMTLDIWDRLVEREKGEFIRLSENGGTIPCNWRFFAPLATRFLSSIFWHNTIRNTEQLTQTPTITRVNVFVPHHPLIAFLQTRLRNHDSRIQRLVDGPFHMPLKREIDASLTLLPSYDPLVERVLMDLEKVCHNVEVQRDLLGLDSFGEVEEDDISHSSSSVGMPSVNSEWKRLDLILDDLRRYQHGLIDVFTGLQYTPFYNDTERQYGTKVAMVMHYLDYLFDVQPEAQVVLGTCYTRSLFPVFKALLKARGITTIVLGGLNVDTTQRNLALFQSGQARVALINANHTASGLNLQNAHYLMFMDHYMSKDVFTQFTGRVARQGNTKQPVLVRFQ